MRSEPRFTWCHDVCKHAGRDQLRDAAGGSELLLGLTISVTCIAEVPIMYMTGWLLEALGVKLVLHGVMAVYILRLLFYSILQHLVRLTTRCSSQVTHCCRRKGSFHGTTLRVRACSKVLR